MKCAYWQVICVIAAAAVGVRNDASSQSPLERGAGDVPWPPPPEDHLDEFIEWLMTGSNIPGLSLAIVDDGRIATKGYGYARLPSTRATPDTLWFTGSTTKAFIAAAAAKMIRDENNFTDLKWTSKINNYLREDFVLENDHATNHVSLEDALAHRTGMPRHDNAYGWANHTLLDAVKSLRYLPLTEELRTTFQYCNTMYMVVSKMLERITGEKIYDLVRRLIWEPVGMRSTFFFPEEFDRFDNADVRSRLARGYYNVLQDVPGNDIPQYIPEPYMDLSVVSGAGATVSSVNDYALWVRALLKADPKAYWFSERNHSSPIHWELYKELVHPRIWIGGDGVTQITSNDFRRPEGYALGWITASYDGYPLIGHTGSLNGFATHVWMLPDLKMGIVTMMNLQDSEFVADLIFNAVYRSKMEAKIPRIFEDQYMSPSEPEKYPVVFNSSESSSYNKKLDEYRGADPYIGIYSHPAYGTLNITLAQDAVYEQYLRLDRIEYDFLEYQQLPVLHVQPSKRTWDFGLYLTHHTDSWFTYQRWVPHGMHTEDAVPGLELDCEGSTCKNEVVMVSEFGNNSFANFEFDPRPIYEGPQFQKATRFGVHLTPETRSAATGFGKPGAWKKGVVWFERVEESELW